MAYGPLGISTLGSRSVTIGDDLIVIDDATVDVLTARRVQCTTGTAIQASDFTLSAGWGSTASVSAVRAGSVATRGAITITSNGTGTGANPTTSFVPPGGAFAAGAICNVRTNGGSGSSHTIFPSVPSTSPIVWTHGFTPAGGGATYIVEWNISG